jgi:hypothetical protein
MLLDVRYQHSIFNCPDYWDFDGVFLQFIHHFPFRLLLETSSSRFLHHLHEIVRPAVLLPPIFMLAACFLEQGQ